ncbi:hypothetical protein Tco_0987641 [Tanacetum coccineum]
MAVIYKDRNNQKKMMRESEVHKFSDGTLTRILEKLDHMVKDFVLFKFNPGMENRIWSEDDKRRSKEFIEMILYLTGNPVKGDSSKNGNLPDHRYIMTNERPTTQLRNSDEYYHDPEKYEHAGPKVTTSQEGNTPQQGG